jgi:hypothetical protein
VIFNCNSHFNTLCNRDRDRDSDRERERERERDERSKPVDQVGGGDQPQQDIGLGVQSVKKLGGSALY